MNVSYSGQAHVGDKIKMRVIQIILYPSKMKFTKILLSFVYQQPVTEWKQTAWLYYKLRVVQELLQNKYVYIFCKTWKFMNAELAKIVADEVCEN